MIASLKEWRTNDIRRNTEGDAEANTPQRGKMMLENFRHGG